MTRWVVVAALPVCLVGSSVGAQQPGDNSLTGLSEQLRAPTSTGRLKAVEVDSGKVSIDQASPLPGTGERKLPAPAPDAPAPPAPAQGTLAPRLLRAQIDQRLGDLQLCRERVARAADVPVDDLPAGQIVLRFTILPTGATRNQMVLQTPVAGQPGTDVELMRCIRNRMLTWRFTAPSGGSLDVEHPYSFSATRSTTRRVAPKAAVSPLEADAPER